MHEFAYPSLSPIDGTFEGVKNVTFVKRVNKQIGFLMVSSKPSKNTCFFYILGKKGVQDDAKMSQEKEEEEQEDRKK